MRIWDWSSDLCSSGLWSVVRGLAMIGADLLQQGADTIMTKNVMVCSSQDTIEDIMHLMTKRRIRHLPVVDDGHLTGMISIGDVVKRRIAATELEAEALRQYIHPGCEHRHTRPHDPPNPKSHGTGKRGVG